MTTSTPTSPRPARAGAIRGLAALLIGLSYGSAGLAQEPAPATAADFEPVNDLNARYKFIERYSPSASLRPGENGQYRVATRETMRLGIDLPEGDPGRATVESQMIYTERPAEVSSVGTVTATVRQYERSKVERTPATDGPQPAPIDNLLIWYKTKVGRPPTVISLNNDRDLQVSDFASITRSAFVPALGGLMPVLPIRIVDTWRVSSAAIDAITSRTDRPASGAGGDALIGKLLEVRRDKQTGLLTAVVAFGGRLANGTSINAQAFFSFDPPPLPGNPNATATRPRADGSIEARGAITEVRLAAVITTLLPGEPQPKRRTDRRELVLQRQVRPGSTPLVLPSPAPVASMANSWLTYTDPSGRFQVRYPQDFRAAPPQAKEGDDDLHLVRQAAGAPDVATIDLLPEGATPPTPEAWRDAFYADWEKKGLEVLRGPAEWLPEADWPGVKVFRVEAAMKSPTGAGGPGVGSSRIHFDGYLIQFPGDRTALAETYTAQDPPLDYRKLVEDLLKSFRLGVAPATATP